MVSSSLLSFFTLSFVCFKGLSSALESNEKAGSFCDLNKISKVIDSQRFDAEAIKTYQDLKPKIQTNCEGKQWDRIVNQINYNLGIIYLSMGKEQQALKSFTEVIEADDSSFKELSSSRLNELFKEYGEWDKLGDVESKKLEKRYNALYTDLSKHINDSDSPESVQAEFQEALTIAPFSLKIRSLYNDYLLNQLSDVVDLNIAHTAVENVQTILDKMGNKIELDARLALYHEISVIQLFVLNTSPQTSLKKCLTLDMDYQPCKDLMKVWNQVSKKLPKPSKMINADEYIQFDTEWKKVTDFLLDNKQSVVKTYGKKLQNYEVLSKYHDEQLKFILEKRPLTDRTWDFSSFDTQTDFKIYMNVVLCESLDMQSSSKKAIKYCHNAMKQSLTPEEMQKLKHYMKSLDSPHTIKELLTALYDTYPHMAINLLHSATQKLLAVNKQNPEMNIAEHWGILFKFAEDHKLAHSQLKFIKNLANAITKSYHACQEQQRQQQQQFFEQMFGSQQQQYQRQQQQHQQQQFAEPDVKTDKDYYKILGLDKSATSKDVRRSYLQLTKKFHPDKQKSLDEQQRQKNEEKMAEINQAYEILSDENTRKKYDQARGRTGQSGGHQGFNGQGGFNPYDRSRNFYKKRSN